METTLNLPPLEKLWPPCRAACPIHQDVRGYLAAMAQGQFQEASRIVRETNPLPSICSTICAHPCEDKCRRGQADQPLSIRGLKRFALEYGGDALPAPSPVKYPQKVAIIGSGPGGLTCAHDLAQLGYRVTIFEREEAPGGALRNFIPLYRLPREVIDRDIQRIMALGVEIQVGQELGRTLSLSQLRQQGFGAILLAVGLPLSRRLRLPGMDHRDVLLALPFLQAVNRGERPLAPGRTVIVIGGGNVAMDVARSAVRCGAGQVKIVCLESEEEMPAYPWEITEAAEEGVVMNCCSLGPKEVLLHHDNVAGLRCMKVLSVFDAQGRFNPSFDESVLSTVEGDLLIMAIGQAADLSWAQANGLAVNERGGLVFDPHTLLSSQEGVFACGEVTSGPGTAVQAMASGRQAALSIARYLGGQIPEGRFGEVPPLQELIPPVVDNVKRLARKEIPILSVEQRKDNFTPVELGFSLDLAVREAQRCLSCGWGAEILEEKCVNCLTCLRVCPYGVPVVGADGSVELRVEQCQACGLCPGECPAQAIAFRGSPVDSLHAQIQEALRQLSRRSGEPGIAAFCCSYGLARSGDSLRQGPANIGVVTTPCIAKVSIHHLIKAFELGADAVVVAYCQEGECPYQRVERWARRRGETARAALREIGLEGERLEMLELSSQDFSRLGDLLAQASARLKGALPKPVLRERES